MKYPANSSCVLMSLILMNALFYKALILTAWKLKFRGRFWTFYIQGMNFSSFQAMEPQNEPS